MYMLLRGGSRVKVFDFVIHVSPLETLNLPLHATTMANRDCRELVLVSLSMYYKTAKIT